MDVGEQGLNHKLPACFDNFRFRLDRLFRYTEWECYEQIIELAFEAIGNHQSPHDLLMLFLLSKESPIPIPSIHRFLLWGFWSGAERVVTWPRRFNLRNSLHPSPSLSWSYQTSTWNSLHIFWCSPHSVGNLQPHRQSAATRLKLQSFDVQDEGREGCEVGFGYE